MEKISTFKEENEAIAVDGKYIEINTQQFILLHL